MTVGGVLGRHDVASSGISSRYGKTTGLPVRLALRRPSTRPIAKMPVQLNTSRPLDQTPTQLIDQPIRAGQLLRPLTSQRVAYTLTPCVRSASFSDTF